MSSQLPLDQVPGLILNIQDILGKNPPPPGSEVHLVPLFHGQDITVSLAQIQGTLKPHYHAVHDETIYVLSGKGQALVEGAWVDLAPGMVMHFQGTRVHAARAESGDTLVFLCHFVPWMKEVDRVFVE
jgi:quercetin dioxygenase-like cupin family protein